MNQNVILMYINHNVIFIKKAIEIFFKYVMT